MYMFSVIVPVYKVEEYIDECIKSIQRQSYSNFELILVDDGSPDSCGDICEGYALNDKRIKVIHQKNMGLSAARNTGIRAALGEYLCFVDSDDYIAENFLQEFAAVIEKNNSDIIICGLTQFDNKEKIEYLFMEDDVQIIKKNIILKKWGPSACNKCFKKSVFNDEIFPIGHTMEDFYLIPSIFLKTNKISCINQSLYFYRTNNIKSITHTMTLAKEYDEIRGYFRLLELQEYIDIDEFERRDFISMVLLNARKLGYKNALRKELTNEQEEQLINFLKMHINYVKGNLYKRLSEKFLIKRLINNDEWFCRLYPKIRIK